MEHDSSLPKKSAAITLDVDGMRIWVDHRRGVGGDEGLTFDVTEAGAGTGARILRFDCFSKTPHYHIGPSGKDSVHDMNAEGIVDPVRWTLDQLKTRLTSLVEAAGFEEVAKRIDQDAIAIRLSQLEKDILAKV